MTDSSPLKGASPARLAALRGALGWLALKPRLRRHLTLSRASTSLGVLGIGVVVLVTAFITANERKVLYAEARDHATQSATYLADHARRLFEVSDIVLHTSLSSLDALSWDEAERSPEVLASMRRLDSLLPYVESVFAADAQGHVRITTLQSAPPGYSIADRSVFKDAVVDRTGGLLIGGPIIGRVSKHPTFLVGRRRTAPDGAFDGLAGAAMTLNYFTDYWRTLDKRNDERIALVRLGSGEVLASYPDVPVRDTPDLGAALLPAAEGAEAGGFAPGPHQFGAFRRVGDLPMAVTVVFTDGLITREWHAALGRLLPLSGGMVLTMVALTALSRRLAGREERVRAKLEEARALLRADNTRLEAMVAVRTADLLESNREIQRFAYIVSHDLRSPLVNIMGFTSELKLLRDEALGAAGRLDATERARLSAEFEEAFGFIGSSIDKMDRLIKAILALSRQGQRPFRPERLDMDALLASVVAGLAHAVLQRGARVVIDPLPPLVADRIAVEQIFTNLLDNAVKYLRAGVPGLIRVTGAASATTVTFTVEDNGRGIDPADGERVFELFRRAGPQDQPGEGIGLAAVRSLVRHLQGTITLDSRPGLGSTFTVTLPQVGETKGAG